MQFKSLFSFLIILLNKRDVSYVFPSEIHLKNQKSLLEYYLFDVSMSEKLYNIWEMKKLS